MHWMQQVSITEILCMVAPSRFRQRPLIELYTASQNKFPRVVTESILEIRENLHLGKITRYTVATLVWECIPEFNIVRTRTMSLMYISY